MIPPFCPLAKKGGKNNLMKFFAFIALAAAALSFGACAKDKAATTTTTHASTGYSK
jgi:hypothetical protein